MSSSYAEKKVFWGMQLTPCAEEGRRLDYSRMVEADTWVTQAAMGGSAADSATKGDGCSRVILKVDDSEMVLCTLRSGVTDQCRLETRIPAGSWVSLWCTGGHVVHITGFREDDPSPELLDGSDDSDDDRDGELSEHIMARLRELAAEAGESEEEWTDDDDDKEDDDDGDDDDDDDDDEGGITFALGSPGVKVAEPGKIVDLPDDDAGDGESEQAGSSSKRAAEDADDGGRSKKKRGDADGALGDLYAKSKADKETAAAADKKPAAKQEAPKPKKETRKKGVVIIDNEQGNGDVATRGANVTMHYTGRLQKNNRIFDSSIGGPPFSFRLGSGEVIAGWDIGVEGMRVGGKRTLLIPAPAGYGRDGAPPDIPPNAALKFDVECVGVRVGGGQGKRKNKKKGKK